MKWFRDLSALIRSRIVIALVITFFCFLFFSVIILQLWTFIVLIPLGILTFMCARTQEIIKKEELAQKAEEKRVNDEQIKIQIANNNEKIRIKKLEIEEIIKQLEHEYVAPEGYKVSYWTTKTLSIVGCHHYIDSVLDINIGDKVIMVHNQTENYPENTSFYSAYKQLGSLRQEIAIEFLERFGSNYCFIGEIVSAYEKPNYDNIYFDIKTAIKTPVLRWINTSTVD